MEILDGRETGGKTGGRTEVRIIGSGSRSLRSN
jgi:hypothetical protein